MTTDKKARPQPETAHAESVDPAARTSGGGTTLHEVRREVQELQERIDQIAQTASAPPPAAKTAPPAPVVSDPDLGANPPSRHPMQEILPEINNLAQRVGGMKALAQIVVTLAQTKE